MNLVVHIPDDFAERLSAGGDVERLALEALALESYRSGRLSKAELRQLLGFGSRPALDAFLLAHDIVGTYSEADLARDRQDLQRLGPRRRMSVEQMLAVGSEIAAMPVLDPRSPAEIMDDLNAP